MKKILSIVIMCALLVGLLATTALATVEMNGSGNLARTRINVKKTNGVQINGVIEGGEYEKADVANILQWWCGEEAPGYDANALVYAQALPQNTEFYFSWDGEYFYVAVKSDLGGYTDTQTWAAGSYEKQKGVDSDVIPDNFLGYGPGITLRSGELHSEASELSRLYYTFGTGKGGEGYINGVYTGQNAEGTYNPVGGTDFDYTIAGSTIVFEFRIPVSCLNRDFTVGGTKGKDFKLAITLNTGVASKITEIADHTTKLIVESAYGVRLGQFGWAAIFDDADQYASFKLLETTVPAGSGESSVTTEGTTAGTTESTTESTTEGTTEDGTTEDTTQATTDNGAPEESGAVDGDEGSEEIGNTGDNSGDAGNEGSGTPGEKDDSDEDESAVNEDDAVVDDNDDAVVDEGDDPVVDEDDDAAIDEDGAEEDTVDNNENAAQTGDPIVLAAIASVISACGFIVAKKRR